MKKFGTKTIKACGCGKETCVICGWIPMDEIRISKRVARWISNFTKPTEYYDILDWTYNRFLKRN